MERGGEPSECTGNRSPTKVAKSNKFFPVEDERCSMSGTDVMIFEIFSQKWQKMAFFT
jgi:hypothetical protein